MSEGSNVNVGEVHRKLARRERAGRTAVEAAGEVLWLTGVRQQAGDWSRKSHSEVVKVVNSWLIERVSVAERHLVADMYARHLAEQVDISDLNSIPWADVDAAWREWRYQGGSP